MFPRRTLTDLLLSRLHDEDITLRRQASFLFAHLDPTDIIPKLCTLLHDPSDRVRSAAELALVSTLSQRQGDLEAVFVFLEHIRAVAQGTVSNKPHVPATPGQVAPTPSSNPPKHSEATNTLPRLLRIITKWSTHIDAPTWTRLAPAIVDKVYTAPGDAVMVQFVSAVAPAWDGPGVGKVVVERVVGVMEGQPRLTEELLRADTDEAALMTRDLAFVRLSPLLILKVLPLEAFKGLTLPDDYVPPDFWDSAVNPISATSENEAEKRNENLAKRLMEALLVRIEHPLEFDPVRKLSSDLLARLPLPLLRPLLTQKFTTLFETRDTFQLRSYLFCAYHMIAVHGQTEPEEVVAVVLGTVVEILGWRESDDEEGLDKLHQGCIECLSLCLSIFATQSAELEKTRKSDTQPLIEELFPKAPRVERPRRITPFIEEISESEEKTATQVDKPTRRTPFIEELPDTDERKPTQAEDQLPQAGGFETVLDRVLDLLHPLSPRNSDDATTYTRGSRSTFMSNTITTAIKKLSSTGSAPQQPSVSEDVAARNLAALQWLARRVVGRLLAVANWFAVEDGAGVYKVAGAACFQALFHIVFSTKGTADLPLKDIADVCINGFRATPDMIRLGSLKLFGAAMSWPNNAFRDSIGPLGLLQAQRALEALVNMETSEEIRRIAEQWLDAL